MNKERTRPIAASSYPRILTLLLACCLLFPAFSAEASGSGGKALTPGDIVTFGHYEQDNDLTNGREAILWRVLALEGDRALLVSEKNLDCMAYHDGLYATWEDCTLRQWLNGEFLNAAFSMEEQTKVLTVTLKNEDNPEYGTEGGNDTTDRVFLLSIAEAEKYFKDKSALISQNTAYAKARGVNDYDGFGCWWLRSPGYTVEAAARVLYWVAYSTLNVYGNYVYNIHGAVRPALYINLDSGYF